MPNPRRDHSDRTPAFRLDGEPLARVLTFAPKSVLDLDMILAQVHQEHCWQHRPWVGLSCSMAPSGGLAFNRDWNEHRAEHMAEAYAEYARVTARLAA